MGIPVYFKTLIDDYDTICKQSLDKQIDYLFFDLNCLIHPCCRGLTDELLMYQEIVDKIQYIIDKVNPIQSYIAIDGPCPRQKIHQQRMRRFKSSKEKKEWDTNAITPGTKFMEQLEIYIQEHLYSYKYILDSSNNPGEGEHKIVSYIKEQKIQTPSIIYGLDADLIMLSLLSSCKDIYLLRERTEYNIENIDSEYIYLDIRQLEKLIIESIKPPVYKLSDKTLLNDYIFLCFLLGNDFVQHTPSINIRYNGLSILVDIYKELQEIHQGLFYIIDTHTDRLIHKQNLLLYLKELSKQEISRILRIMTIREKQHNKMKRLQYNEQLDDLNLHKPILDRENELNIFKNIKYWKINYYMYHIFHRDYNPSFDIIIQDHIDNSCRLYLESLYWTSHYYFRHCISWKWMNEYNFGPSLNDIYDYLLNNDITINTDNNPILPEKQLELVLPPSSFNLLHKKSSLSTYMYPHNFDESHLLKRYNWESYPIIPYS